MKSAEIQLLHVVICSKLKQNRKIDDELMIQYINCVFKVTKCTMVLQVQTLVTCFICEISSVYNQRSGKVHISDVGEVNKSRILVEF